MGIMDDLNRMIGRADQADKAYADLVVQSYASIFRAFCAQEGVTRAEALELTKAIVSARESTGMLMATANRPRPTTEEDEQ